MDLFTKLQPFRERLAAFGEGAVPFDTIIEETLSPTEVLINGKAAGVTPFVPLTQSRRPGIRLKASSKNE